MSPVLITSFVFTAVASLFCFKTFFTNTAQKKKENLFLRLSQEGTANSLVFCSQEILQNKVIGIDGVHRKIMILEKIKNKYDYSVISLDEVQHCGIITSCRSVNLSSLKRFDAENNPYTIELRFEFKNHAQPASVIFYDSMFNSKKELAFLKAKAEYWKVMFSKMLTSEVRLRA